MNPIKIEDVLITGHKTDHERMYLILNRMPDFKYEQIGSNLIGYDCGFYNCLRYQVDRFAKAFAGRKFDIELVDGKIIKASGQYWSIGHPNEKLELCYPGVSTIDELLRCYVFTSGMVAKNIIDTFLKNNNPIYENYYDFEKTIKKLGMKNEQN